MTPQLAVSIINYRTPDMTIASAKSALAALEGHEGRVIIVDNASGDGSVEWDVWREQQSIEDVLKIVG